MLKKRIIPLLLYSQGRLVKSVKFSNYRDVGDPVKTAKIFCDQDADELILLNIDEKKPNDSDFLGVVARVAETCNVPICVGGGVASEDYADELFSLGADKIAMGDCLLAEREVAYKISSKYGSQALVGTLNTMGLSNALFSKTDQIIEIQQMLEIFKFVNIGELFINSVDRDGLRIGLDIDIYRMIKTKVTVPIILGGGCGDMAHFRDAFEEGVDAVACGSFFCFGDNNPLRVKSQLLNCGFPLKRVR